MAGEAVGQWAGEVAFTTPTITVAGTEAGVVILTTEAAIGGPTPITTATDTIHGVMVGITEVILAIM